MGVNLRGRVMAKRGPKPKPRLRPRHLLEEEIPPGLTERAQEHYRRISSGVRAEGYASVIDTRAVVLAAECAATVDQLTEAVSKLPSVVNPATGEVHPLIRELRAQRAQLQGFLGALLMTPKARSSSRLSQEQLRTPEGDDLGDFLASEG